MIKKNIFRNMAIGMGLVSLLTVACDDNIDPLVTEIETDRAFSVTDLEARVRNDVNVQLGWTVDEKIATYTVEFYADSAEYLESNLIGSVEGITADEVPIMYYELPGQTNISARVKAISAIGLPESKWSGIVFETSKENLFSGFVVGGEEVTLNWMAGASVTKIVVTEAGASTGMEYLITDSEKESGMAVIGGLTFDTNYTADIYNGTNLRGTVEFKTNPDGILVNVEDNIETIIADAPDGETLLLVGGLNTASMGTITIDKNLNIIAYNAEERPVLNVQFVIGNGATTGVTISGIDFVAAYTDGDGAEAVLDHGVQIKPDNGAVLGDVLIENCSFQGHLKSLMSASSNEFAVNSLTFNNCVVDGITCNGGDFIDMRKSYIADITITECTFSNIALNARRDFIRFDGSGNGNAYDDGSNMLSITVSNNTFYNESTADTRIRRIFYVRWSGTEEVITCNNNLFAYMGPAIYSDQGNTAMPSFSTNYYVDSVDPIPLMDASVTVYDNSGTIQDPGFVDAANGDYTVTNDDIIFYQVGASRWR